jgi:glutamate decarboxylase
MLAHKRSWQLRRRAEGKPVEEPNMVVGADAHTCWEKFARYFEVEPRIVPLEEGRYTIGAADVAPLLDENTIGVAGLLGTTFTGQMDDLRSIDALLTKVQADRGWRIPMHIDAASGGFILPFSKPQEEWDFRLPSVRSINVSNHKFGLVYPGMGTVVFREAADLPEELIFHINYLGGDMPNYTLNFSRPAYGVILQYFSFLRLGHTGYRRVITTALENARALAGQLAKIDGLELLEDGSNFPIVVARTVPDPGGADVDLRMLSRRLRERGWIVPAYTLPPNAEHITVLRMVIKENFSRDMVELLAADVHSAFHALSREKTAGAAPAPARRRPHC